MGLTRSATGYEVLDSTLQIVKQTGKEHVVALAGYPNVGKSTVFNGLTGLHQHTGNWPGKTVTNTQGYLQTASDSYVLVDLPGTYSLLAHSAEEEVARNFICFGEPDLTVVVCDATCLSRNLSLVLQILEITPHVIVCVNLMDEAKKRGICLDLPLLSERLGVPVVGTAARNKRTLKDLTAAMDAHFQASNFPQAIKPVYRAPMEAAISLIEPALAPLSLPQSASRFLALQLLDPDTSLQQELAARITPDELNSPTLRKCLSDAWAILSEAGLTADTLRDTRVSTLIAEASALAAAVTTVSGQAYTAKDRRLDALLTSKCTGYPIMLLLLAFVFFLTITGANVPSALLAKGLFRIQDLLTELFSHLHAPDWLHGVLVLGLYRVLAWIVSVMLPPMAIFFPLFTLLEDAGYLPRIAYNLDRAFQRCKACGKQALCMCMGFGCNAAGIIGCRIIDSPRERLLAILTNNFVPCNGRFPALIAILTMFFVGTGEGIGAALLAASLLTLLVLLGIFMTFLTTRLLSATLLKGVPSFFTLELPPYRRPQIGTILVRSLLDRTLFVLARAVLVAAPAGILIWLTANVTVGDATILTHLSGWLDPFARLMSLDGVILLAFILGFPANEIVLPIILMAYTAQGSLIELDDLTALRTLLVENGWTWRTAVSTLLFSLMHWPCSTTLLTIKKETGSLRFTLLAALLPTIIGILICMLFTCLSGLI